MNRNDSYNDSGFDWLGEIPSEWGVLRMCYMFKPVSIKNTSGEMNLSVYRDYGVIPTNSRDDNHNVISEDTSNYKLVEKGDFVMNKMKCWMGSLGLSDYRGIVSPSYTVMKPLKNNNHKYIHYLLRSKIYIPQYKRLSYGVREGQWDLRFEDFRELPCLIPPLYEQKQIVNFLDDKTQKIDSLIQQKEKKIELLKEKRTSLINNVVTKGLDYDVEMKDSGVEWIGEIPSHWKCLKMKYGVSHISEKSQPNKTDIKISPENVESSTGVCFNLYSEHGSEGMRFISGDILLNKLRLYLKKILFTEYDGYSLGEMIVLRTNESLVNKYFYHLLFNQGLIDLLDSQSTGVKLPRVSPDIIMNSEIIYPPIFEQQQIVEYLDKQTEEIDTLTQLERKKIETLKEYRQSLISDVVTGKIRVCEEDNSLSLNSQTV